MADERDVNPSQQYRRLEPLEPPAGVDSAILSAARRAAHKGQRRQRWYYSLAAAAVLVLAIALTLQLERRSPEREVSGRVAQGPVAQAPAPEPAPAAEPPPAAPRVAPPARPAADAAAPAAAATKPAPPAAPAQEVAAARAAPEKPERWLERIAELRSRARHEEADRQLAEFRRVYPNYPLSEIMRERVEGR